MVYDVTNKVCGPSVVGSCSGSCIVLLNRAVALRFASQESFSHVDHWFGEVTKYAMKNTSKMLIGNKIDAPDHRVTPADGKVRAPLMLM